jgi:hypothetical protein
MRMSTMTESKNETKQDKSTREEIQELKHTLELQTARQAGVDATQVATTAGAQTTQAAAHAGTWSTMVGSSAGFVIGIFVALAFVAATR